MAGLTTETTIRVIRRFASGGLVTIDQGKIMTGEITGLKAACGKLRDPESTATY
ncbi:hypothetical protein BH20ACI2_BH20ACI2_14840 [soil metagenome]